MGHRSLNEGGSAQVVPAMGAKKAGASAAGPKSGATGRRDVTDVDELLAELGDPD